MSTATIAQSHIQYRRQSLPQGHGVARPSKKDPVGSMDKAVSKVLEERKEILVALSKV